MNWRLNDYPITGYRSCVWSNLELMNDSQCDYVNYVKYVINYVNSLITSVNNAIKISKHVSGM